VRSLRSLFAEPKYVVHSLTVQAELFSGEQPQRTQFQVLLRHLLGRFFHNESSVNEGSAQASVLQIAYAIALPGLCVALFLFPPYHFPGGRPFWSQISDQYFYVMYSFAAVGAITIFVWDLFFPDRLDVFVLSTLSLEQRTLFRARVVAVLIFLAVFLVGANALGTLFFPASADLPSLSIHIMAHFTAVTASGLCIASTVLAVQSLSLVLLGEELYRKLSPIAQAVAIALLFIVLLSFPLVSRVLEPLLTSKLSIVAWFPPFWFLGIYEVLLHGSQSLALFRPLASMGALATLTMAAFAVLTYPFAYRARMRSVVEGSGPASTRGWLAAPSEKLLHATLLRAPERRGVFHFISQTLMRTPRHRVYLAMYCGFGLALIVACTTVFRPDHGRLVLAFSNEGLRAAIPIVAFWTIAGLRAAFTAPGDRRLDWPFRVIHGKPGWEESTATRSWVLICSLVLTLGTVVIAHMLAGSKLRSVPATCIQLFTAVALSVLLTDAFFLNVKMVPFTGVRSPAAMNLAYVLIQYLGLFPPLVLVTLSLEDWMAASVLHLLVAIVGAVAAHLVLIDRHKAILERSRSLIEAEEDEEEFPQRLGLRY
jgi:hypothetical protein